MYGVGFIFSGKESTFRCVPRPHPVRRPRPRALGWARGGGVFVKGARFLGSTGSLYREFWHRPGYDGTIRE